VSSEAVLKPGHDPSRRGDGELLAGDLEDQCPERVERWKLAQPGPRAEVRPRVDQACQNGIGVPQVLPGCAIGERRPLAGFGVEAHDVRRRSVRAISIT
jgi:hypothetical protein